MRFGKSYWMKANVGNGSGGTALFAVFYRTRRDGESIGIFGTMTRAELEHVIRAAGSIAETDELVILGSQAILGSFQDPPEELRKSMEVDLYPLPDVEKSDLIDGSIGEGSPFHETFGYYAHGVGPETAILPERWKERLVVISNANTRGVKRCCLHPVDIAISKLAAGRKRDIDYVRVLVSAGLVHRKEIRVILQKEMSSDTVGRITTFLESL